VATLPANLAGVNTANLAAILAGIGQGGSGAGRASMPGAQVRFRAWSLRVRVQGSGASPPAAGDPSSSLLLSSLELNDANVYEP